MPRSPNGPASRCRTFEGEARNVKLTTNEDFTRAEAAKLAALERRAHRLRLRRAPVRRRRSRHAGRRAHCRMTAGLSGHSDADVVLHALVDAILGRARRRRHRRAFSAERSAMARRLLRPVPRLRGRARCARAAGASRISTSPSSARRRASARIATPCAPASPRSPASPIDRVGVKATTSEKMGFTGRGEGMAAFANATVRLPWSD